MFLKLREEKGTKTSYTVRKELRILYVLRLKESEHFRDLDTSVVINNQMSENLYSWESTNVAK